VYSAFCLFYCIQPSVCFTAFSLLFVLLHSAFCLFYCIHPSVCFTVFSLLFVLLYSAFCLFYCIHPSVCFTVLSLLFVLLYSAFCLFYCIQPSVCFTVFNTLVIYVCYVADDNKLFWIGLIYLKQTWIKQQPQLHNMLTSYTGTHILLYVVNLLCHTVTFDNKECWIKIESLLR